MGVVVEVVVKFGMDEEGEGIESHSQRIMVPTSRSAVFDVKFN